MMWFLLRPSHLHIVSTLERTLACFHLQGVLPPEMVKGVGLWQIRHVR